MIIKNSVWILLPLCTVVLLVGCTSSRGIIALSTRPEAAAVYYNKIYAGETPVEFEYDFSHPATLEIKKEGYYTETEILGERWVVQEYQKGNYTEGPFMIQGCMKNSWKVNTMRKLEKKEEEKNKLDNDD